MSENINFIEWDAKRRQYLIRLAGNPDSQEIRLNKMKAAEDMYEALKALMFQFAAAVERPYSADTRVYHQAEQALAKADGK